MSTVISHEAIMALCERSEPVEDSPAVQVGDWVTVPGHAQGTVWQAGHVTGVQGDNLYIGYGGRNTPSYNWLYGMRPRTPVQRNEVGEIWRKRTVVKRSSFGGEVNGRMKIIPAMSVEDGWYHVQ